MTELLKQHLSNEKWEELPIEKQELLDAVVPKDYLSVMPGAAKLTSIKSGFVTQRLNAVFGLNWVTSQTIINKPEFRMTLEQRADTYNPGKFKDVTKFEPIKEAVLYVEFYSPKYNVYQCSYGGSAATSGSEGDSYKGAYSDAMTKILAMLSVGVNKIWLNEKEPEPVKKPPIFKVEDVDSKFKTIAEIEEIHILPKSIKDQLIAKGWK